MPAASGPIAMNRSKLSARDVATPLKALKSGHTTAAFVENAMDPLKLLFVLVVKVYLMLSRSESTPVVR
jgi:hypothetical protein